MGKGAVSRKGSKYKVEDGKLVRTNPFCPKCGPGVFMADHGDRYHCGRCGYTIWKKNEKKEGQ